MPSTPFARGPGGLKLVSSSPVTRSNLARPWAESGTPPYAVKLPTGFELATVTVRDEPLPDAPTTGGGANPVDRKVMSLGFRRGPLSITVTTRAGGDDPTAWRDPFVDPGSPATPPDAPETRTVTDGRYNGLVGRFNSRFAHLVSP